MTELRKGGINWTSVLKSGVFMEDSLPGSFGKAEREVILFSPRKEIPKQSGGEEFLRVRSL